MFPFVLDPTMCPFVCVCAFVCVLQVESTCVADQMWYFPLLVPFRDHVPVKADLSDLQEKIKLVTVYFRTNVKSK